MAESLKILRKSDNTVIPVTPEEYDEFIRQQDKYAPVPGARVDLRGGINVPADIAAESKRAVVPEEQRRQEREEARLEEKFGGVGGAAEAVGTGLFLGGTANLGQLFLDPERLAELREARRGLLAGSEVAGAIGFGALPFFQGVRGLQLASQGARYSITGQLALRSARLGEAVTGSLGKGTLARMAGLAAEGGAEAGAYGAASAFAEALQDPSVTESISPYVAQHAIESSLAGAAANVLLGSAGAAVGRYLKGRKLKAVQRANEALDLLNKEKKLSGMLGELKAALKTQRVAAKEARGEAGRIMGEARTSASEEALAGMEKEYSQIQKDVYALGKNIHGEVGVNRKYMEQSYARYLNYKKSGLATEEMDAIGDALAAKIREHDALFSEGAYSSSGAGKKVKVPGGRQGKGFSRDAFEANTKKPEDLIDIFRAHGERATTILREGEDLAHDLMVASTQPFGFPDAGLQASVMGRYKRALRKDPVMAGAEMSNIRRPVDVPEEAGYVYSKERDAYVKGGQMKFVPDEVAPGTLKAVPRKLGKKIYAKEKGTAPRIKETSASDYDPEQTSQLIRQILDQADERGLSQRHLVDALVAESAEATQKRVAKSLRKVKKAISSAEGEGGADITAAIERIKQDGERTAREVAEAQKRLNQARKEGKVGEELTLLERDLARKLEEQNFIEQKLRLAAKVGKKTRGKVRAKSTAMADDIRSKKIDAIDMATLVEVLGDMTGYGISDKVPGGGILQDIGVLRALGKRGAPYLRTAAQRAAYMGGRKAMGGGVTGAMGGSVLSRFVGRFLRRGKGVKPRLAWEVAQAQAEKTARTAARFSRLRGRVTKGAPMAVAAAWQNSQRKRDDLRDNIRALAANPAAVEELVKQQNPDLQGAALEHTTEQTIRIVEYVSKQLPWDQANELLSYGHKWPISKAEKKRFDRIADLALGGPVVFLERVERGDVRPDDVEAMEELYPIALDNLRTQVAMSIPELRKATRTQRLQLSLIFGVPVDSSFRILGRLQEGFLPPLEQPAGQADPGVQQLSPVKSANFQPLRIQTENPLPGQRAAMR